ENVPWVRGHWVPVDGWSIPSWVVDVHDACSARRRTRQDCEMYDSSFDQSGGDLRAFDRRLLWVLRLAAVLAVVAAASAGAQIPNAPVLQNAWATPGVSGALNITGGSDGSVYAGAGSYAFSSGKFQLSGGIGYGTRTGGGTSMASYGVRLALPLGGDAS